MLACDRYVEIEQAVVLLECVIQEKDETFCAVWLLCILTLDGKLCLRDVKNAAFVELDYPLPWGGGKPGKRHNLRAHNAQDVFDWLNRLSLSASAYIENVAYIQLV